MSKRYITTIMTNDGVIHKWFENKFATEPSMVIYDNEIIDTMEFDCDEHFEMFDNMFSSTLAEKIIVE